MNIMLLHYRVAMPDCLGLSSLFTIPSTCRVCITPWSPQLCKKPTRNLRRNVSKSAWKGAGAMRRVHAQRYSSEPAPERRVIPSPNAGGSPCPRSAHPAWVPCDMVRDYWRGQHQWWEGLSEPQVPPAAPGPKAQPVATRPCKGAFAGPFRWHLFLVCFAFFPFGFSLSLGMLSGPGHFASTAVQHCWSRRALAWELVLPASLLESPPSPSFTHRSDLHGGSFQQTNADEQPSAATLVAHSHWKHVQKREVR